MISKPPARTIKHVLVFAGQQAAQISTDKIISSYRVYSFGIGQDVDRDLVREIARRGNGAFDFVDSFTNMTMEKKVLDMLDIAMKVKF